MAPRDAEPRIVAELGRPETPEETAARKAENSRKHRANQTLFNLVIATLVSLAVVVVMVLVVVRPDQPERETVDPAAIAAQAGEIGSDLTVAEMPDGWAANRAEVRTGRDGITTWTVGYLTDEDAVLGDGYIGATQALDANETWVAVQLELQPATGVTMIGGREWTVYDDREDPDAGNLSYSLVTWVGPDAYVLSGRADPDDFEQLAAAMLAAATDRSGQGEGSE